MISNDNIEQIKEVLYIYCKGKGTFEIGWLINLQQLINSVLNDSSIQHYRIYEACRFLNSQGYIMYKPMAKDKNIFTEPIHMITQKLWDEMSNKAKLETEQQLTSWY